MVHGLSCFTACGIFLDQGLNPHLLHWQVDSLSLNHQGSPGTILIPPRLDEKTWPLMVSWCRVGDFCKEMIWWGFVSGGEIYVISSTFILCIMKHLFVTDFSFLGECSELAWMAVRSCKGRGLGPLVVSTVRWERVPAHQSVWSPGHQQSGSKAPHL